jgi:flagellar assembly factor FliW
LKVKTTRFGELEVDESRTITFAESILGFPESKRFILLEHETNSPFKWLQSLDEEKLAFILIDPLYVMPEYRIEVMKEDITSIELTSLEKAVVICIVNIGKEATSITANLIGPIIVNPDKMLAKQVVALNSEYSIRHSIMDPAKKAKDNSLPQKE